MTVTVSLEQMRARFGAAVGGAELGSSTADRLCSACVELLGVDGAAISVVSDGVTQGTLGASSPRSRRVDEYQFTFGDGPCVAAAVGGRPVLVADLDSPEEQRWPLYAGAMLEEGVRAVFAWPIVVAAVGVGALGLFRHLPGALSDQDLAGYRIAAELASIPFLDLGAQIKARELEAETGGAGLPSSTDALDRVEVHQATGMLVVQLDVDAAEATSRLRAHAIATGQTASEVAWSILQHRLVLTQDHEQPNGQSPR